MISCTLEYPGQAMFCRPPARDSRNTPSGHRKPGARSADRNSVLGGEPGCTLPDLMLITVDLRFGTHSD